MAETETTAPATVEVDAKEVDTGAAPTASTDEKLFSKVRRRAARQLRLPAVCAARTSASSNARSSSLRSPAALGLARPPECPATPAPAIDAYTRTLQAWFKSAIVGGASGVVYGRRARGGPGAWGCAGAQ